jgi:hypothetical protein
VELNGSPLNCSVGQDGAAELESAVTLRRGDRLTVTAREGEHP